MSARKLRAIGKYLLLKPLEPSETTRGGIVLAPTYQQPSGQAVVLSVGGRVKDTALQPGALVFYSWINGREVEHDGGKCVLLDADAALGVGQ